MEVPRSQVKHKHVYVCLLLTVMSLSADSTLSLTVFVCVVVCVSVVVSDYVFLSRMNVSPRCCAVRWSVNVCLVAEEERERENQYNKAFFVHPVRHTDLSVQPVT